MHQVRGGYGYYKIITEVKTFLIRVIEKAESMAILMINDEFTIVSILWMEDILNCLMFSVPQAL